jgi:hypothetical protein
VRPRVRAVGEAREAEWGRIDQSRVAGDHIGDELAGPGADAKAVAGKAVAMKKPGMRSTGEITGIASGITSIIPPQLSATSVLRNSGKASGESGARAVDDKTIGSRVEHADGLERRSLVQPPVPRQTPFCHMFPRPTSLPASRPAKRSKIGETIAAYKDLHTVKLDDRTADNILPILRD